MKKFKHIFSLLLCCSMAFGQTENYGEYMGFELRIPNAADAPTVVSKTETTVILSHPNTEVQAILNSYTITGFNKWTTNPTRNPILQEMYSLYCTDIQLIQDLQAFAHLFTEINPLYNELLSHQQELLMPSPVEHASLTKNVFSTTDEYTPNDYGFEFPQTDLDLINAKKAWSFTKGNPNVIIGISDWEFTPDHEELEGTLKYLSGDTSTLKSHGVAVAILAAGNTNNGVGLAAIGHDCFLYAATTGSDGMMSILNEEKEVKIINGSFGSGRSYSKNRYQPANRVIQEYAHLMDSSDGVSFVFAAGNSIFSGETTRSIHYPAGYENVISVSIICHNNLGTEIIDGFCRATYNYDVDIAAPGRDVPVYYIGKYQTEKGDGSSFAAPMVSGTIGLMLSVNYSLTPVERETILKLSSANIYHTPNAENPMHRRIIPENEPYLDQLGAGRLDAGKAVEMAYRMAQEHDTLKINGRDFYRNWRFVIKNAPEVIEIENETFRDSMQVEFTAREEIILKDGVLLRPNEAGSIELKIDDTLPLAQLPPTPTDATISAVIPPKEIDDDTLISAAPNPFTHNLTVTIDASLVGATITLSHLMLGTVNLQSTLTQTNNVFNTSHLTTGVYTLTIASNGTPVYSTIVVKE